MALTAQQQNFVSELVSWAEQELAQREKAAELIARWNLNDFFNGIQDGELVAIPGLDYLTNSKLANGVNALEVQLTAWGDNVSGQAVNLIELKG